MQCGHRASAISIWKARQMTPKRDHEIKMTADHSAPYGNSASGFQRRVGGCRYHPADRARRSARRGDDILLPRLFVLLSFPVKVLPSSSARHCSSITPIGVCVFGWGPVTATRCDAIEAM
jgi:hypothetical protein